MTRALLCLAVLLSAASTAAAENLVVIGNPENGVTQLSREQLVNIFMGRYRKLPSGISVLPIDLGKRSEQRRQFYQELLHKDLAEIDAYWTQLVFSGQTSPPMQAPDDRTAVELVAGNRTAIAYVDRAAVDSRVRIIAEIDAPQR